MMDATLLGLARWLETNHVRIEVYPLRTRDDRTARWCVRFRDGEVKVGGMLGGSGDGDTLDDAVRSLVRDASGRVIVFHAASPDKRREVQFPIVMEWDR